MDGTPCDLRDGERRVCVQGDCRPVGCDGMLGSPAREDLCRRCGGDGSGCITSEGILEEKVVCDTHALRPTRSLRSCKK